MYSENSATYFPTYFKKYTTKNVIIKEFIEGVSLGDHKALKEQLNVKYEAALAYVLLEVKNLMEKYQIINGDISADNIVIRKYVKPYRPASAEEPTGESAPPKAKVELQKKKFDIIKPHYQVIFLSQKNYQPINQEVKSSIDKFWNDRHKSSIKLTPNRSNFYSNLSVFQYFHSNLEKSKETPDKSWPRISTFMSLSFDCAKQFPLPNSQRAERSEKKMCIFILARLVDKTIDFIIEDRRGQYVSERRYLQCIGGAERSSAFVPQVQKQSKQRRFSAGQEIGEPTHEGHLRSYQYA
jgi:hypothetical protein